MAHPRSGYLRALAVWVAMLLVFAVLYATGSGHGDAQGIAEARQHRLSSVDGARVASIEVQPGQNVTRGQVLVKFSTADIDAQIEMLKVEIDRNTSAVDAAGVAININSFDTQSALRKELDAAQAAEAELRATAARESAELRVLLRELSKERELVASGLVRNDRELDLTTRSQVLREAVRLAPTRLAAAQARSQSAQQRLEQWTQRYAQRDQDPSTETRLQPLRDAVRERKIALQGLQERRARMSLSSPVDGHVTSIDARPGDAVRPGDPVVVVTEAVPDRLVAYVTEHQRVKLSPGQAVTVRRMASQAQATGKEGMEFSGEVVSVASAVTLLPPRVWQNPQLASWGREVYIRLAPGAQLSPGELVDVSFRGPTLQAMGLPLPFRQAQVP